MQQIIDAINDHLLHPEKTEVDINIFGFYNSLNKLIYHCSKNPSDTKISLQLNELWYVVDDLHHGIVFKRYIRPDENGCLWEYEVDPDDRKVLNSKKLGEYELSESDKIILEGIERYEEKINNERKELGYVEQFKTHGIRIGEFTKREKYKIHSRLDGFVDQEKWAYERRDSSCRNVTTIYQRFDDLKLPRTAHLKYEDYIQKITNKTQPISQTEEQSSTETSSTLTIGELTVEQTENLFKLVNGVVFEGTSIDFFVESLNNHDNNTLNICTRGKAKAIILFHELDSVYGIENIISKRQTLLNSFNPSFDKYYTAHSGSSEYARLSPDFKTKLNAVFK